MAAERAAVGRLCAQGWLAAVQHKNTYPSFVYERKRALTVSNPKRYIIHLPNPRIAYPKDQSVQVF
jgi:hypothetical protein